MKGERGALGERVIRYFLSIWEQPPSREVLVGMLRSAATNEHAATLVREFFSREVLARIAAPLGHEDAQLRATLVSSQLVGLAMVRYVVRIEPLASASPDILAAAFAPTLQRYLTETLDLPTSNPAKSPRSKKR